MVVVKPQELDSQGIDNPAQQDDFETIYSEQPTEDGTIEDAKPPQFNSRPHPSENNAEIRDDMMAIQIEKEAGPQIPEIPGPQPQEIPGVPGAAQFQGGSGQPTVILMDAPPEKAESRHSLAQKIFIKLYYILMVQFGFMAGLTATLLFVEPVRNFLKVTTAITIIMDIFLFIFCSIYQCAVYGLCAKCCGCSKSRGSIIASNIAVTIILGVAMAFTAATLVAEAFLIFNMMMMIYYLIVALFIQFSGSVYQAKPQGYSILIPLFLLLTGGAVGIMYAAHSGKMEEKLTGYRGYNRFTILSNDKSVNMVWEIAKAIIAGVLFLIVGIFVIKYSLVEVNDDDIESKKADVPLLNRPEYPVLLATDMFVHIVIFIWFVIKKILKRLKLCKTCLDG